MYLPNHTLLQGGKYKIVRHISSGGFGNTYEGVHTMMDTRVAIKEFFPKTFCNRDENTSHITVATQSNRELVEKLRKKFIEEAKAVFKMDHPDIVKVHDIFEENGTAYYVMNYIDGKSLGEMVKERGALPEAEAVGYIRQVADALKYVHSLNRLHLDIKPGNVMVDARRQAILIDFGASKHYDMESGENTSTLMGVNTKGYAPVEQSTRSFTKFSPATDIYALGATLYKLLTGITPPDANLLVVQEETLKPLPDTITLSTRNAVLKAMTLIRADRPQNIDAFLSLLDSRSVDDNEDTVYEEEEIKRQAEEVRRQAEEQKRREEEARRAEEEHKSREQGKIVRITTRKPDSSVKQKISSQTFTVNNVSFEMMKVEAGTFTMGATSEMIKPAHQVTLTKAYYIGKTEVTQALWRAVMGNNPSNFKDDNLPVERVSWNDCQRFISKLNSITGLHFRLPTEAEWEFAARGGNNSKHYQYSGSNQLNDVAWYDENSGGQTQAVATKQPNELGIYDMSGNVWEWCSDWKGDYSNNSQTDSTGPSSGSRRVLRGGSWFSNARFCRSSFHFSVTPDDNFYDLGFRLVLEEEEIKRQAEETRRQAEEQKRREKEVRPAEKKQKSREREEIVRITTRKLGSSVKQQISSKTFTVNNISFEMMKVEAGTFTMGATSEMKNPFYDEKPAHQVTLTNNYYIGKTEVTQALWKAVMGNNPSRFKSDNLPVECVSWNDCQRFISKLNSMTGLHFRLPTEAEWEFAARGGNNSKHYSYSGSNQLDNVAWYDENSGGQTQAVATKLPNELGIYDMSGNVKEWCSDRYGYYSSHPQTDPTGPNSGSGRVCRGGGWGSNTRGCRSSLRGSLTSVGSYFNLGLRLVLEDDEIKRQTGQKPGLKTTWPRIVIGVIVAVGVMFVIKIMKDRSDSQETENIVQVATSPQEISSETFTVNDVSFEMMKVEAGTFTMGATSEMEEPYVDEKPAHQVTLIKAYYIGKTEVTQALWKAVMGNNPSEFKGDNLPVEKVSWNDCQKFISKLNSMTGRNFRLPTEAEWEFAARGGNNSKHYQYSGSKNIDDVAWYDGNSGNQTHTVATKQPNELGIYDMSGNVWEWCSDWYGDYSSHSQTDPIGSSNGSNRVFRGGSWNDNAGFCRSSGRCGLTPDFSFSGLGLRLVLVP